jgi:hypothetical protein
MLVPPIALCNTRTANNANLAATAAAAAEKLLPQQSPATATAATAAEH